MASKATYALCFALLVVIATAADMPGMPGMAPPPQHHPPLAAASHIHPWLLDSSLSLPPRFLSRGREEGSDRLYYS
ncbi:hypothetical protein ACFX19_011639 [Malus domestica]